MWDVSRSSPGILPLLHACRECEKQCKQGVCFFLLKFFCFPHSCEQSPIALQWKSVHMNVEKMNISAKQAHPLTGVSVAPQKRPMSSKTLKENKTKKTRDSFVTSKYQLNKIVIIFWKLVFAFQICMRLIFLYSESLFGNTFKNFNSSVAKKFAPKYKPCTQGSLPADYDVDSKFFGVIKSVFEPSHFLR